ncbi:unnamed protein product [Bursaphelenchus okinawaensis]|uniref:Uncharacterized protein n=1 Tax=Bursaphelenchus okinawaensis TaxID=465554 RepID=A0A811JUJ8_9BILA|nr:unnamed protein product [Bursaphelenchus okinawaensis]CAG9083092.1 unnamed protein product [Bursaphelenchus okinawaensis]
MFYACLAVLILFGIMCFCVTIAIIDLEAYNFGLYIVLLCIVGTMLACALCIANPNACPNPVWYSNFCLMLQEMYPAPDGTSSPKMTGLRSRMMAMQTASATHHSTTGDDGKLPLRNESRATVAMLAPAVHIMHQVWKGMAWVADGIDEEEEDPTRSYDNLEVGQSSDSDAITMKRLSTVIEHDPEGSDFASCHDVMV